MRSGARRRDARRALATIAASFVAAACSALIDHADSQCATNDDCARFAGTVCIDGGCAQGPAIELPDGAFDTGPVIGSPCSSNQDCIANGPYICRHTDNTCQALFANGCGSVAGSYSSDDTVLIGAILPLSGPHASTGTAMADAITLGVSDFDLGGGLPPLLDGGLRRPVAVLFCDENDESAGAAATHLIALGIAILIGTGDSESTADVAGNKSVPGGALLMAPRAPAGLSAFLTGDLVWRTCPSSTIEANAIAALLTQTVEPALAQDGGAEGGGPPPSVEIVHASDVESTALDSQILSDLPEAGILDYSFGDPDDPLSGPTNYSGAIESVLGNLPSVVVLLGSTQVVKGVLEGIESDWQNNGPRPHYVLSSSLQVPELLEYVGEPDAGGGTLPSRILGTAPGSGPKYTNFATFLVSYKATFRDGTIPEAFGVAQAYDALYAVTYAAAITRNADLVGGDERNALLHELPDGAAAPAHIDVGPSSIATVFNVLANGGTLALNGASAPLAFDPHTGDIVTDVQVWCVTSSQSTYDFQLSGQSYSADAGLLQGTLGAGCVP